MTDEPDYDLETFVNKAESALAQQTKHFSALRGGCRRRTGAAVLACGSQQYRRWQWGKCFQDSNSVPLSFLPEVIKSLRLAMQLEEQASKQINSKKWHQ